MQNLDLHSGRVSILKLSLYGPAPTRVYALSFSSYLVKGNNPLILLVSVPPVIVLLMLEVIVSKSLDLLYCNSYCIIIPLGITGAIHDKFAKDD